MIRPRASFVVVVAILFSAALFAEESIRNWAAPPLWSPAERIADDDGVSAMGMEAVEGLPTAPLPFHAITPCRIVDTRPSEGFTGAYGPPALVANATRPFDLNSAPHCAGIPANAEAYSLNVTVTETLGPGDIRLWPTGSFALVSTQNWPSAGMTLANAAIVPAGTNGSVTVEAAGSGTHLIIDFNGYYAPIAIVNTVNGLSGAVTLAGSSTVTITPSGNTLTVNATGGPGGLLPSPFPIGRILRSSGTGWVMSNSVYDDGTDFELGGALRLPFPARIYSAASRILHNTGSTGFNGNTFVGHGAGNVATPGVGNTGVGFVALQKVEAGGVNNVAVGQFALQNVTTGGGNVAIGASVGTSLATGSNNLYIASAPAGDESGQIRIGRNDFHTQGTVIASIHGFGSSGGIPVIVNAGGRLGTTTSSLRYKENVRDIGSESDGLMSLRPVTFKYKKEHEPGGLAQYGLIAEEVAEIYPELVVYDDEGQPQAIRSQLLDPLLLNEIQKQRREIEDLKARLEKLEGKSAP